MIISDAQLHQAQTDIQTLWRFLEAARATHAPARLSAPGCPYLLQLQERQQEAIEYLTRQTLYHSVRGLCGCCTQGSGFGDRCTRETASGIGNQGIDGVANRARNPRTREGRP